jgi:hypothetical protein
LSTSTLAKATIQEENGAITYQEGDESVEFDLDKAIEDWERTNFEEQMVDQCTCAEEFGLNCPYNY